MDIAVCVTYFSLDVERLVHQAAALSASIVQYPYLLGHVTRVPYSFSALRGPPFFRSPTGRWGAVYFLKGR